MAQDKELKVMKSKVLAAADKCGTAREVLKEVFPEAFEEEWDDVTDTVKLCQWATGICTWFPQYGEGPFILAENPRSCNTRAYKIENGHIYRKHYQGKGGATK